jgi:hypothetical protein
MDNLNPIELQSDHQPSGPFVIKGSRRRRAILCTLRFALTGAKVCAACMPVGYWTAVGADACRLIEPGLAADLYHIAHVALAIAYTARAAQSALARAVERIGG